MIKRAIKSVSVIVFWIVTIWLVSILTRWWVYRNYQVPQHTTIVVNDTLHITQYKEKLSIIEKIKWKTAKPETIWVSHYEPWMNEIFKAVSVDMANNKVKIVMQRDSIVKIETYRIGNNFRWYGTPDGSKLLTRRFNNPIRWQGIVIGCSYDNTLNSVSPLGEITPYIETGIIVWKLNITTGLDKNKVYGKIGIRLW